MSQANLADMEFIRTHSESFWLEATKGALDEVQRLWNETGKFDNAQDLRYAMLVRNALPFSSAAIGGHLDVMEFLWEQAGTMPEPDLLKSEIIEAAHGKNILIKAYDWRHTDLLKFLWDKASELPNAGELQTQIKKNNQLVFNDASSGGSVALMQTIWDTTGEINSNDDLQISLLESQDFEAACVAESSEAADFLLSRALEFGGEELQQKLMKAVAENGNTQSKKSFARAISPLLESGAELGMKGLREAMEEIPEPIREHIPNMARLRNTAQQQDVANSPFKGRT